MCGAADTDLPPHTTYEGHHKMKYYLAAIGGSFRDYYLLRERFEGKIYELRSYWEIREFDGHTIDVYGKDLFIDSGAFSARTRGVEITPEDYGGFIKQYSDQIHAFANLDVIPSSWRMSDLAVGAKLTLENQKRLEDITGRAPLPVFHKGEPIDYLHHYLENYDYICIGGLMNPVCLNRTFFEQVWQQNMKDGKPWRKLHAFGLSSHKLLLRFPWYSADSSSWLMSSKYGIITIPVSSGSGGYNFLTHPLNVGVSGKSKLRTKEGKHFDNLRPHEKEHILQYLSGLNLKLDEDMRKWGMCRMPVNIYFWKSFGEQTEMIATSNGLPHQEKKRQIELL
jgi:hypothetical protein